MIISTDTDKAVDKILYSFVIKTNKHQNVYLSI